MKNIFLAFVLAAAPAAAQTHITPVRSASLSAVSGAIVPASLGISPLASPLVRLIVEPALTTNGQSAMILQEHNKAIEAVLAASAGRARLINSDGPSSLFSSRVFIETDRAAAAEVARGLGAAGLRTTALDEMLSRMNGGAGAPATEEELRAAAALFENGDTLQRADAFGRLASAVAAGAGSGASAEVRTNTARALYSGIAPVIEAFNAIRGEQRRTLRSRLEPVPWDDAPRTFERELFLASELARPELKSQVEPIRALAALAAEALLDLKAPYSASLVNALLPHAEYAAAEALAAAPERASRFVAAWLGHLLASVKETEAMARAGEHNGISHSGGIGWDIVLGYRHAVAYYPKDARQPFRPESEHHNAWTLLGMSDAAVQAWTGRFLNMLPIVDAAVSVIEAADHRCQMEKASRDFDAMAGRFASDPTWTEQLAEEKRQHLAKEEEQYQKYHRIDGIEPIDRALAFIDFGPYDHLKPGFSEDRFLSAAAGVLHAALEGVEGAATLKVVIDASLHLTAMGRQWAQPRLAASTLEALDTLERLARDTAARLGLALRPNGTS